MINTEEIHTLIILVDNIPGVLARVIGLFSSRGYNIDSLTVSSVSYLHHVSRITIVTSGTPQIIEQIKAQLQRLVPVHAVRDLTLEGDAIEKEIALIKLLTTDIQRQESLLIANKFKVKVVDTTCDSFIFHIEGNPNKINTFIDLMNNLGRIEVARSGVVAISRGSSLSLLRE